MTVKWLDVASMAGLLVGPWVPFFIRGLKGSSRLRPAKGLGAVAATLLGLTLLALAVLLSYGIAYWASVDSAGFLMRIAVVVVTLLGFILFLANRLAALEQKLADREEERR